MLLYFVSFLDRVNVGFAAFTMNKAIGLTPSMFGFGGGMFFLGYILFQVPSNLILLRVGARVWIARVVVAWGVVSVASAFVIGPHSFYALRFLLGLAESGFFPGNAALPELLVPCPAQGRGDCRLHGRRAVVHRDWLTDIRRADGTAEVPRPR